MSTLLEFIAYKLLVLVLKMVLKIALINWGGWEYLAGGLAVVAGLVVLAVGILRLVAWLADKQPRLRVPLRPEGG